MIVVTGATGQLGRAVCLALLKAGAKYRGVSSADFDISSEASTRKYIEGTKPTVVIHTAAYTAVDKAETDRERCHAVNVIGSANIAKTCEDVGAVLMHISTDYVFDGKASLPYEVHSAKNPINYYGKTKALAEDEVQRLAQKHFIIRTSSVFSPIGQNFPNTIARLARDRDMIKVVDDQISSPTYTVDLADLIINMMKTDRYGIYHATNEGFVSWFEFAKAIVATIGSSTKVEPIKSHDYKTDAIRPLNSRLSKAQLDIAGFRRLPTWEDALARHFLQLNGDKST